MKNVRLHLSTNSDDTWKPEESSGTKSICDRYGQKIFFEVRVFIKKVVPRDSAIGIAKEALHIHLRRHKQAKLSRRMSVKQTFHVREMRSLFEKPAPWMHKFIRLSINDAGFLITTIPACGKTLHVSQCISASKNIPLSWVANCSHESVSKMFRSLAGMSAEVLCHSIVVP